MQRLKWNLKYLAISSTFLCLSFVNDANSGSFDRQRECPIASHLFVQIPINNLQSYSRAEIKDQCGLRGSKDNLSEGYFCMHFRNESNSNLFVITPDFGAYSFAEYQFPLFHMPYYDATTLLNEFEIEVKNGIDTIYKQTVKSWTGIRCYDDSGSQTGVTCSEVR